VSGHLSVVGLGPGDARWRTPEAEAALARAEVLYGYAGYLERVPTQLGQARHASDNREEAARAEASLRAAAAGRQVAIVTGGDPGVFAIANAVCEQIEAGPESFRQVEVTIIPGVSAMLAVAARVGAPLGGDFCAISLSDNLKPWELIEQRLAAAAGVGFVIALYNPISRTRPSRRVPTWQPSSSWARRTREPSHAPAGLLSSIRRAWSRRFRHDRAMPERGLSSRRWVRVAARACAA